MKVMKLLLIVVAMFSLVVAAHAQRRRSRNVSRDIRISKQHPTIYITFEGFGQEQEVWLRLHNNTRWRIEIPTVEIYMGRDVVPSRLLDKYRIAGLGKGEVAKPRFYVEERDGVPVSANQTSKPLGTYVPPGHSVLFNVPREHLSDGRRIYLIFHYQWERGQGYDRARDPVHRVEFSSSQLPASPR
jgi:hypothetical protein